MPAAQKKPVSEADASAQLDFETALTKLEAIVAEMEAGGLSLEKSMAKFEQGIQLAKLCTAKLGEAEKRVEILLKKADATLTWRPRDDSPQP